MKNLQLSHCYMFIPLLAVSSVLNGCKHDNARVEVVTTPLSCEAPQIPSDDNKSCVIAKITDIKPIAVNLNQPVNFEISGENFVKNTQVNMENCKDGKLVSSASNKIVYQCTPQKVGDQTLALSLGQIVLDGRKVQVAENTSGKTISLPPQPANPDATIQGTDVNKNGVRDEVERALAQYVSNPDTFDKTMVSAKAYQMVLDTPTPQNRAEALAEVSNLQCQLEKGFGTQDNNVVRGLTLNTQARREKYLLDMSKLEGGYTGSELGQCE